MQSHARTARRGGRRAPPNGRGGLRRRAVGALAGAATLCAAHAAALAADPVGRPSVRPTAIDGRTDARVSLAVSLDVDAPGEWEVWIDGIGTPVRMRPVGDGSHAERSLHVASVSVPALRIPPGECAELTARASHRAEGVVSEPALLCASTLAGVPEARDGEIPTVTDGDVPMIADELAVTVEPGLDERWVRTLARFAKGRVVGAAPEIDTYRLRLDEPAATAAALEGAAARLRALPSVRRVRTRALDPVTVPAAVREPDGAERRVDRRAGRRIDDEAPAAPASG